MKRDYEKTVISSRMTATKSIVSAVTTLVICCVLFYYLPQLIGNNRYVRQIKGGHPFAYPNISYEDAFEKYYDSPKWSYSRDDNGDGIVSFTGKYQEGIKRISIELRYRINSDDTFNLIGGKIDGKESNLFELLSYDVNPFIEYKK